MHGGVNLQCISLLKIPTRVQGTHSVANVCFATPVRIDISQNGDTRVIPTDISGCLYIRGLRKWIFEVRSSKVEISIQTGVTKQKCEIAEIVHGY